MVECGAFLSTVSPAKKESREKKQMFKLLQELLMSNGAIVVNRQLAHSLGLNEALVYSELLSKQKWYKEHDKIKDGWFFSTGDDLKKSTTLSRFQQDKAIQTLTDNKLIFCKVKGMPARRYFKINEDVEPLLKLLKSDVSPVLKKLENKFARNLETSFKENNKQVLKKLEPNNNNIIRTNNNNNINTIKGTQIAQADLKEIINAWNDLGLTQIRAINKNTNRYKLLKARLEEYQKSQVIEAIELISKSDFLQGQNKNGWQIDFDWLVRPNNFIKVLEGRYTNRKDVKDVASRNEEDNRENGSYAW